MYSQQTDLIVTESDMCYFGSPDMGSEVKIRISLHLGRHFSSQSRDSSCFTGPS